MPNVDQHILSAKAVNEFADHAAKSGIGRDPFYDDAVLIARTCEALAEALADTRNRAEHGNLCHLNLCKEPDTCIRLCNCWRADIDDLLRQWRGVVKP